MRWARLLKRVFDLDVERCGQCGGKMRIIAAIEEPAAIVLAVIAMAHAMELKVVAEGVETEAQLEFLRANACDEIQGYFFSRPLDAAGVTAFLRERQRAIPR